MSSLWILLVATIALCNVEAAAPPPWLGSYLDQFLQNQGTSLGQIQEQINSAKGDLEQGVQGVNAEISKPGFNLAASPALANILANLGKGKERSLQTRDVDIVGSIEGLVWSIIKDNIIATAVNALENLKQVVLTFNIPTLPQDELQRALALTINVVVQDVVSYITQVQKIINGSIPF